MITVNIREEDEFIKLGQALKKAGDNQLQNLKA